MNFSAARLKSLVEADPRLGKNIAAAAGFSPGSLSHWTLGKRVPGADELAALAKVFDVPLDYFFDGSMPARSGRKPRTADAITGKAGEREHVAQASRRYGRLSNAAVPAAGQQGKQSPWELAMAEAAALVERAHSLRAALQKLKPALSSKRTVERARREAVAVAKDFAGNLARRSK